MLQRGEETPLLISTKKGETPNKFLKLNGSEHCVQKLDKLP